MRLAWIGSTIVLLTGTWAGAADDDWKTWLARPLSPGAVAALVGHGGEPEVQARWREALKDSSAPIRAAAARAWSTTRTSEGLPDLAAALATENDPAAAREMARALAYGGDPSAERVLLELARRLPALRSTVAPILGTLYGAKALAHVALFREPDHGAPAEVALIESATQGGRRDLTAAAAMAVRDADDLAWSTVLHLASRGGPMDDGPVAASLSSPEPAIRAATYWHLATLWSRKKVLAPVVQEALASAREALTPAPDPRGPAQADADLEALFAYEMLARLRGRESREATAWMEKIGGGASARFRAELTLFQAQLTAKERALLRRRKIIRELPPGARPLDTMPGQPPTGTPIRAGSDFPPGYATGLVDLLGCKAGLDVWAEAEMRYDARGRLQQVTMARGAVAGACLEAARVLLLSVPPLDDPSTEPAPNGPTEVRLLPLQRATLASLEEVPEASTPVNPGTRLGIEEPRKVRDAAPIYPEQAKREGIQGVVVLETTITPTGSVAAIRVLRGDPALIMAAVRAVVQWRYTPTRLGGVPVPVIMTITVNFRLR
jgi:TonB family protein